MLEEALVIFACVNSVGCKETSSQYYSTHKELREFVQIHEKKAKEVLGPFVVESVGPIIYMAVGGTGIVRLSRDFSFQMSNKENTVWFRKDF